MDARDASILSRRLIGGGGAALAISPFVPWVSIPFLGGINLWTVSRLSDSGPLVVWLAVLVGVFLAIGGARKGNDGSLRLVAGVAGGLVGLIGIVNVAKLIHGVGETQGFVHLSFGPFLAMGSIVAILVGAFLPLQRADKIKIAAPGLPAPSVRRVSGPRCMNGHPLDVGDDFCFECGAPSETAPPQTSAG